MLVWLCLATLMPTVRAAVCSIVDGSKANDAPCTCGIEGFSKECTTSTGLICFTNFGGGSCRKTDVGAYGYFTADSGRCNTVRGRNSLLNKASCERAAASLELSDTVATEMSDNSKPHQDATGNMANWDTTLSSPRTALVSLHWCWV